MHGCASKCGWVEEEEISEPGDVIEMGVRKKDIQMVGLEMLAEAVHAGASIEQDANFWQHQASRLPPRGRKIPAGSEENELHGDRFQLRTYNHHTLCFLCVLQFYFIFEQEETEVAEKDETPPRQWNE
jgi:hypothetical protein